MRDKIEKRVAELTTELKRAVAEFNELEQTKNQLTNKILHIQGGIEELRNLIAESISPEKDL